MSTATPKPNANVESEAESPGPNSWPLYAPTFSPFDGLAHEFNTDLEVVSVEVGEKQMRKMLRAKRDRKQYLPGQPRIRLDVRPAANGSSSDGVLIKYLRQAHSTQDLDELLPLMRYIFVQTPSYNHIMPLHHQKSHARRVVVDENPGLHLLWYYDLIFVKPVPAYFYSAAFWEYIQNADEYIYRACLGFMRSYHTLIQYEIDFHEACELRLIPKKDNGELPTYEEWCEFIEPFGRVGDHYVNRRYHYGELRLSRINRTVMLFKGGLAYFHIYPQWGSFLAHILAPIITLFAVCSVVLNSMQVSLAAIEVGNETGYGVPGGAWPKFLNASLWFPVVVMLIIAAVLGASLIGIVFMGVKDMVRTNHVRERKKQGDPFVGGRSHGIIW